MDTLLNKIEKTDTCWNWTGVINHQGYGVIRYNKKPWRAHRLVYTLLVGEIPEGLHIDHLCRNRKCVNPEHLEPVTPEENYRRGFKTRYSSKVGAINYLIKNNVYTDEWTGAGMYEAIVKVVNTPKKYGFDKKWLDSLLEEAKKF